MTTEQPVSEPDVLDQANARYWQRRDLEGVMAGSEPFRHDESFEITGLTDEEWVTFVEAIHE